MATPESQPRAYELPRSDIRLERSAICRYSGGKLVSDYALADLYTVVLRHARGPGELSGIALFGVLTLASGAAFAGLALHSGSVLTMIATAVATAASAFVTLAVAMVRSNSLVLNGRHGAVTHEVADDLPVAEAFLTELREHAERAHASVTVKVERS